MSTAHTQATPGRSTVGTLVLALTFATVIGGVALRPAFSQEFERRPWHQERRAYERERQGEHRRHWREWQEERRGRTYSPYGYYAPPPVVYPPPVPSPGLNFFFHIP
jgi:hypothetical protein